MTGRKTQTRREDVALTRAGAHPLGRAPVVSPRRGLLVAGKYQLDELLGDGGMGMVWRAHHRGLDTDVAVKFMHPAMVYDQVACTRFQREARAAARLRSRHVVRVLDHGVDEGTPYIAMELLRGESLTSRLQRGDDDPVALAVLVAQHAAKALAAAHSMGVLHRDLKPSNIFICPEDGEEVVKLLDFGVAKLASEYASACTRRGTIVGSLDYMSPEQTRAEAVDTRSDLWALTVVLFVTLTLCKPFDGDTELELVENIRAGRCRLPSELRVPLPSAVDAFFRRAFAPERDDRFADAAALVEAFVAALGSGAEPVYTSDEAPTWVAVPRQHEPVVRVTPEPRALEGSTVAGLVEGPRLPQRGRWSDRRWLGPMVAVAATVVAALALQAARAPHVARAEWSEAVAVAAAQQALTATRQQASQPAEPAPLDAPVPAAVAHEETSQVERAREPDVPSEEKAAPQPVPIAPVAPPAAAPPPKPSTHADGLPRLRPTY